jgi:tRNA 2-thiocytidine biosynthesis protein TtcA
MRNLTGTGRFISNKIGKAIADHDLIRDKDKIIVAVSGGKDSMTLLKLLLERRRWAPISYDILAVHINTDFKCAGCVHKETLESTFKEWGCEYRFINIKLRGETPHEDISCFWCSWNRRKALFKLAEDTGYNKIALGHHKDDVIETILLNLFYNGEISAINARQPLFGGKISIIRPLFYVEEDSVRKFAAESGFPAQICRCPNAATSKRALMKETIAKVSGDSSLIKSNILNAPSRIRHDYLGAKKM